MNQFVLIVLFNIIFFLATDISNAAPMIYRVQQMKAMRQRRAQGMTQQEYEEYQEQQQGGQPQSQQAPAQPTYQQTVDQRNQAIAQAIINAHSQSVSTNDQGNTTTSSSQQQAISKAIAQQLPSTSSTEVKDVVDLSEVWKKLDTKSTVWMLLIDDQAKLLTVSEYINRFQKEGVKITAPPLHYVQAIDQIAQANPQMLQRPFGELLQILAIVDYDFDNGMNKDALAKAVLGEAGYEQNKMRFTQQAQGPSQ